MAIRSQDLTEEMKDRIALAEGRKVSKRSAPVKTVGDRMNKWEREYAEYLRLRSHMGIPASRVLWFEYEPVKLRLGGTWQTGYAPDFLILFADGHFEFHEVKGFMRDDAAVKIKVAARLYPIVFKIVRKVHGKWMAKTVPGLSRAPQGE